MNHAWVQENLDRYLAGDLTTDERESVERHAADCDACKQALTESRQLEQVMSNLFADARLDVNLEDRLIQELRKEPVRSLKRPTIWRFVGAAAAVLVVGLVGFAVQAISEDNSSEERKMLIQRTYFGGSTVEGLKSQARFIGGSIIDADQAATQLEKDLANDPNYMDKAAAIDAAYEKAAKMRITDDFPVLSSNSALDGKTGKGPELPADPIPAKVNAEVAEAKERYERAANLFQKGAIAKEELGSAKQALAKLETRKQAFDQEMFYGPEKGRKALDDQLRFYRSPDQKQRDLDVARLSEKTKESGYDKEMAAKALDEMKGPWDGRANWSARPSKSDIAKLDDVKIKLYTEAPLPPPVSKSDIAKLDDVKIKLYTEAPLPPPVSLLPSLPTASPPVLTPPVTPAYFPMFDVAKQEKPPEIKGEPKTKQPPNEGEAPDGADKKQADAIKKMEEAKKKPDEPPLETNRKIIRTGEMEFEIDSFDKSVDNITRLITSVKGGFVATINSDKLANGKMKGSIVVRMPPQYLDKFVLDLRRELAKSGELKNQRIISLDVTKQYTDIESRLRAARTMEDRLIQIIKIGKGEIKDLVAAERELGVWRTKIEEMEGEIRYYSNQVSLSTLTISLTEKEILAPTAIVVTESVRMRLEVDDVAKAHQAAMAYVEEVKGRITRSELKQHSAGQLQSILCAEIPPAKKDFFRNKLKALGIVSSHEENQSQHTEGGSGRGGDLKPRTDDVHFDITMHNTANVRPRLTADLKVATTDVPAAYARLLDEIARVKGQVRDGRLNEQDKQNITAFLDFNVPTNEKPAIDKLLLDIGPVLERTNILAPISELSTARKFGYTLLLRDFASIPPSKAFVEIIAVNDVPAIYARLQEVIVKAKGQIAAAALNEQDKLNINAQFDFTVLIEQKPAIDAFLQELLKDSGTSLSQTKMQAPMNQLSTPKKFGYTLALRDVASVPATQMTVLKVATVDVAKTYATLIDAIARAKGTASDKSLHEQDKLNITAQIKFTVPSEEKIAFDKQLEQVGVILSRENLTLVANLLSTGKKVGYVLELRDFAAIPASQVSEATISASNVQESYARLTKAITDARGQMRDGSLNEQDKLNVTGILDFTVPSAEKPALEKLLGEIGTTMSRKNIQTPEKELPTDRKVGYRIILRNAASFPPREKVALKFGEVADIDGKTVELKDMVIAAKGRLIDSNIDRLENGQATAVLLFEVPFAAQDSLVRQMKQAGIKLVSQRAVRNSQIPENELTTAHILVTLTGAPIVPPNEGVGEYVRTSLYLSFRILAFIVMAIVVGLSAVVPCVILIWIGYKVYALVGGSSSLQPSQPSAGGSAGNTEAQG